MKESGGPTVPRRAFVAGSAAAAVGVHSALAQATEVALKAREAADGKRTIKL